MPPELTTFHMQRNTKFMNLDPTCLTLYVKYSARINYVTVTSSDKRRPLFPPNKFCPHWLSLVVLPWPWSSPPPITTPSPGPSSSPHPSYSSTTPPSLRATMSIGPKHLNRISTPPTYLVISLSLSLFSFLLRSCSSLFDTNY